MDCRELLEVHRNVIDVESIAFLMILLAPEVSFVGLVHFADPQSMDYPIWTIKWTTLMDSQMDYLDGYPDGLLIWTT